MIGLAGTRADPVMVHFAAHCLMVEQPFAVLDLMDTARDGSWQLSAPPQLDDHVDGTEHVRMADLTALYVRPIYLGTTPTELARWQGLMDGFTTWTEEADVLVVNRVAGHQLNSCKPAHYAWLTERGFLVPPSLLSADPARVAEFIAAGPTVVKPVSGTRASTQPITADDLPRLAASDGPVLVQRQVPGDDVRAHVVGDRVVACRFTSDAIDYRSDRHATRVRSDVPPELAGQLVAATAEQGLLFAGWDFKVDAAGTYWCLECNPMPGYSFYDRVCDGDVSAALLAVLTGRT